MKKLTWRLGKLPTPDELRELVKDKIITQDEARDILFRNEDDSERDTKSYQEEIKFLRDLVEKLSNSNRSTVYEYICTMPSNGLQWFQPYMAWCSSSGGSGLAGQVNTISSSSQQLASANGQLASANGIAYTTTTGCAGGWVDMVSNGSSFSDIQTF